MGSHFPLKRAFSEFFGLSRCIIVSFLVCCFSLFDLACFGSVLESLSKFFVLLGLRFFFFWPVSLGSFVCLLCLFYNWRFCIVEDWSLFICSPSRFILCKSGSETLDHFFSKCDFSQVGEWYPKHLWNSTVLPKDW